MLNNHDFEEWCQRLGLLGGARAVVERIRTLPPSRLVQSAAGNVSGRYPSRKMGVTIQFESHRNELAAIYEMEHDDDVIEYYDQPEPVKLDYLQKSGRRLPVYHTPDFFVIRSGSVGWEECKTEEELVRLAKKSPARYVRGEDGRWRCPPGEEYAARFGFYYRLRSSAGINWTFQRNIEFLEDYFRQEQPEISEAAAGEVSSLVASEPGITLADLLSRAKEATPDDIYTLIATGGIYADLSVAPLAEPDRVRVFRDIEIARAFIATTTSAPSRTSNTSPRYLELAAGNSVEWDGRYWTILNVGIHTITLRDENQSLIDLDRTQFESLAEEGRLRGLNTTDNGTPNAKARELLRAAGPEELREANRRYSTIAPFLQGLRPLLHTSRTERRWIADYRAAEQKHGTGFVGLIPRRAERGNRNPKLPENTLALLNDFIEKDYETIKQKRMTEVYGSLVLECESRGVIPPSYMTFTTYVHRRAGYEQTRRRKGPRAAYQKEPFYWELGQTTPRHGDRPFQICHIDHTELDIELVSSQTGQNLGRPWVTFITDAFSRRILAVWLSFDPPSYRSCMMVIRECVRLHHRLPQIMVVDGGKEFHSIYLETLLARYECTKKTRPGAKPRFGSVIERLFGTTNTRFIHNLAGNTQITRNVRQITKGVDPKHLAVWTLGKLHQRLCEWAYEIYDTIPHPALGQTPREAFLDGMAQSGLRPSRIIPYDEDFYMLTLPSTPKGTAKVVPGLGVKINYISYWSDAFRNPEVEGEQVPVRYDPFDACIAYAFVHKRWVRCVSQYHNVLSGRSEREIMLATLELRRRNQGHAQQFVATAKKIAEFLSCAESEEPLMAHSTAERHPTAILPTDPDARAAPGTELITHTVAAASSRSSSICSAVKEGEDGNPASWRAAQKASVATVAASRAVAAETINRALRSLLSML